MNEELEEEYTMEELENIKAKTNMYKSATWLMNIISATILIFALFYIIIYFTTAETIIKLFS